MSRQVYRKEIEILFRAGHSAEEIKVILDKKGGTRSPSRATVYRWIKEVQRGDSDLCDRPRSGGPVEVVTAVNIECVQKFVEKNAKVSLRTLSGLIGISKDSIKRILDQHLDLIKMNCRWVPKKLTQLQKAERVKVCKEVLGAWGDRWSELLERLVTCDETWVSYENPHDRISGGEWRKRGSNPPELPKIPNNPKKIMASVFWDFKGVIHVEIMEKGHTINSEVYCSILSKVRDKIKEKRRGKLAKGIILLDDNARPHRSKYTTSFVASLKWKSLPHPPYSPDLAPSDYHLFRNLKYFLKGKNFDTQSALECAITSFFDEKSSDFYNEAFIKLKTRLIKCIELKGEYL